MFTASSNSETKQTLSAAQTLNVAIDGPAGAGKSTVAQRVAAQLGYLYIDTGAMYRAATWVALEQRADLTDQAQVVNLVQKAFIELRPPDASSHGRVRVFVNNDDVTMIVRSRIIGKFVSQVAAIPGVRKILVEKQQAMGRRGGVVMDGRDIGTVVLPDAALKFFLTASAEIRAERRLKELHELGQVADLTTLMKEIEARDQMDMTRETSPLRKAQDALVINTDTMTIDEVANKILGLVHEKLKDSADS